MSSTSSRFKKLLAKAEDKFDALKLRFEDKVKRDKKINFQTYIGYGNAKEVHFNARLLREKGIKEASEEDSTWDNIVANYRRFSSDEIPFAATTAFVNGTQHNLRTDDEGYLDHTLPLATPYASNELWQTVELSLAEEKYSYQGEVKADVSIMVPPSTSNIGIISDIDDTVLVTNASSMLKMMKTTFVNNALSRLPFVGVASFYRALQEGTAASSNNPVFYVSSSPWNLYDFLYDFLEIQNIPLGPILLRDLGVDSTKFISSGHGEHKLAQISRILQTYPEMKFILLGDSGEKDPEIFTDTVKLFPNRILSIYIRDVSEDARDQEVRVLGKTAEEHGVELLLVPDSLAAATHALSKNYITQEAFDAIKTEVETPPAQ